MKATVEVTRVVEVTYDPEQFDDEFMEAFKKCIADFDDIEDHVCYLAAMHATGVSEHGQLEGYGKLKDMGISCKIVDGYEVIDNA